MSRLARHHALDAPCMHLEVIPVEGIVTGEIVATLCADCDEQLPEWYGQIPVTPDCESGVSASPDGSR